MPAGDNPNYHVKPMTDPSAQVSDQHRELYDEGFAAEQRRLGRRRVLFITVVSAIGGTLILGSFFMYGWLFGERLRPTKKDRFALVTAPDVSEAAGNTLSLRLDRERIRKHRDRHGVIRLSYRYDDGVLKIQCDVEVYRDDLLSRAAYAKKAPVALQKLKRDGWAFSVAPGASRIAQENESTYGSLAAEGQDQGHFFIFRTGSKIMQGKILGHHFADKRRLNRVLTDAVRALGIYNQ